MIASRQSTLLAAVLLTACQDSPVAPGRSRPVLEPPLSAAALASYTLTRLPSLGGTGSYGLSINDDGDVAGYSLTSDDANYRAALWSAGEAVPRDLGPFGATENGVAQGINKRGDVVGFYISNNGGHEAALWPATGGVPRALGTLGGSWGLAEDINDGGDVVGYSNTLGNASQHATFWPADGGPPRDLGALGGPASYAVGINAAGDVVGWSYTPDFAAHRATLWPAGGGAPRHLGSLGGTHSEARGINASGDIVGWSNTPGDVDYRATLWPAGGGAPRELGNLGKGTKSFAFDINDAGDVVGYAFVSAFGGHRATLWPADGRIVDLSADFMSESIARRINSAGQIVGYAHDGSSTYSAIVWDRALWTSGFVNGNGSIVSPAGSYAGDASSSGRATFGFVSRYQRGDLVPTGKTRFQFPAKDLNFESTTYEQLVIAGAQAKYIGSGTINGEGDFAFLLLAVDGDAVGGDDADRFRIKIWNKVSGSIIYDNQQGAGDDAEVTTAIETGSIAIHK